MKKVILSILSLLLVFNNCTTTILAVESNYKMEDVTENDKYVIDSISPMIEDTESDTKIMKVDMDYIIANSTNVTQRGSEYCGSYVSPKYDTGFFGYKYQISFEWVAEVNEDGDYCFKTEDDSDFISAYTTTYTNYAALGSLWSSYRYELTRNTNEVSKDRKSVTFYIDYKFVVTAHDTVIPQTYIKNNKKVVTMNELL